MEVELWDTAAARASGAVLAIAKVSLDLAAFKPFMAQPASVELSGSNGTVCVLCHHSFLGLATDSRRPLQHSAIMSLNYASIVGFEINLHKPFDFVNFMKYCPTMGFCLL